MNNTAIALFIVLCVAQIFNIIRMEISAHKIRELQKHVTAGIAEVYVGMMMMLATIKENKDNIAKLADELFDGDEDRDEDTNKN